MLEFSEFERICLLAIIVMFLVFEHGLRPIQILILSPNVHLSRFSKRSKSILGSCQSEKELFQSESGLC